MNTIWRFYVDQDRQWRWQRLTMDRVVVNESRTAYKEYEGCLIDAQNEGYVFYPSQAKVAGATSR